MNLIEPRAMLKPLGLDLSPLPAWQGDLGQDSGFPLWEGGPRGLRPQVLPSQSAPNFFKVATLGHPFLRQGPSSEPGLKLAPTPHLCLMEPETRPPESHPLEMTLAAPQKGSSVLSA